MNSMPGASAHRVLGFTTPSYWWDSRAKRHLLEQRVAFREVDMSCADHLILDAGDILAVVGPTPVPAGAPQ